MIEMFGKWKTTALAMCGAIIIGISSGAAPASAAAENLNEQIEFVPVTNPMMRLAIRERERQRRYSDWERERRYEDWERDRYRDPDAEGWRRARDRERERERYRDRERERRLERWERDRYRDGAPPRPPR
ncbi:MAG: hypothetical protein SR1Q7_12200 [Quinella sp. 1Q7]|nr:hypothetical protein [Quinella sp. 1Q7]